MNILFTFLIVVSVYHLVWENLIAPTIRMSLRFKLYALRDEVRWFQMNATTDARKTASMELETMINNAIRLLHTATISSLYAASKELQANSELARRIEKRRASVIAVPELAEMSASATDLVARGFIANSGGWFLYLIPVFCLISSFAALKSVVEDVLPSKSNEIAAIDLCPA